MATQTEASPLLRSSTKRPSSSTEAPRPPRTVTFNTNVSFSGPSAPTPPAPQRPDLRQAQTSTVPPVLGALNSRLRRRNSAGSPLVPPVPKLGAQRTTKHTQKLKLLPTPDQEEDGDEESGRDVYSQFTRIKDPTARRDAARLGKEDRARLPRVTAYCTAGAYNLEGLMRFFKTRTRTRGTNAKQLDEVVYTPWKYPEETVKRGALVSRASAQDTSGPEPLQQAVDTETERRFSDSAVDVDRMQVRGDELINVGDQSLENAIEEMPFVTTTESGQYSNPDLEDLDTQVHTPEVFLFDYGTVVIWGMTEKQEERFLKDIAKFEKEKLAKEDMQVEQFSFYYHQGYQARIYNDFISLRDKKNYMVKLALSHALSQSVKTSLYEDLVDSTIETTKDLPEQISSSGKVHLSRKEINMQIGELFILRINIHLQGHILDSPEIMWSEPSISKVYDVAREYLEIDQRGTLLTQRLAILADLLELLKGELQGRHSEYLEWIVIILIAMEILVAAINIVVDVWAGD